MAKDIGMSIVSSASSALIPGSKIMRRINPIGMRVVVRMRKESNKSDAGLYLPEGAKDSIQESVIADVVEVASAMDEETSEEANISGIPLGSVVVLGKNAGVKIPWDDELRIVDVKEVLAIIFEVEVY